MNPSKIPGRNASGWILVLIGGVLAQLGLGGCGSPPQVDGHDREVIVSLATAISARNTDWLEKNARLIETRKNEGALSESAFGAFNAIVAKARAGQWEEAEQDIVALREAQAPSAEDLDNLAKRKLAPDHAAPKAPVKARVPRRS